MTVDAAWPRTAKPFIGDNFQATLKDLEAKMREAAANLEFETAARLRDEIKRLKMLDLEFANEVLTAPGEAVDKTMVKRVARGAEGGAGGGVSEGAVVGVVISTGSIASARAFPYLIRTL